MAITLSVLVGTCNRLALLKQCLDSLLELQKLAPSLDFKIYVIDAGSTDGSLEYIKSLYHPRLDLIEDGKKLGQSVSFNKVCRGLSSKYICWLSDDNQIIPKIFLSALEAIESDPSLGLIGLKVKDILGPHKDAPFIGGVWKTGILNVNQGILRREAIQGLDLFNESVRDYGIDIFLTTQVLLAKYKVAYTKEIAVLHHRDHENFPGAIENLERIKKIEKAHALYDCNFLDLIRRQNHPSVFDHAGRKAVAFFYKLLFNDLPKLRFRFSKLYLRVPYFILRKAPLPEFIFQKLFRSSREHLLTRMRFELQGGDEAHWLRRLENYRLRIEARSGILRRDLEILIASRVISPLDLIRNRTKPIYLVQKLRSRQHPNPLIYF